jgi:hypothetical protein
LTTITNGQKQRPKTKGSLWLWSTEKKYTAEGIEIQVSGSVSAVTRNLNLLKFLAKSGFRPNRVAMLREAIRMIENGETGEVKY